MVTSEQAKALEQLARSFTPTQPINLLEFLAGRLQLLYRVQDAVRTPGLHVILYGERGAGKTSVARVMAHGLQEPDLQDGRRAIMVSCSSSDDYSSIWQRIAQEILIAERQLGFLQHDIATITGRLSLTDPINDPNTARLFVQSLPNPSVIIIDEFDRVPQNNTRRLMADTIKLFSDTNTKATIVIVGVAESISELIAEHESISRNIAQIQVEQMTLEELSEIVQKGFARSGLTYEKAIDNHIAWLSQGYPHYTHLLGLWSGRRVIHSQRTEVTTEDLSGAISDALQYATGSVQQEYETAIATTHTNTLYKDILLACALTYKDSLGRFNLRDIQQPLQRITGRFYATAAYQGHLARFCEQQRGSVLKRTGQLRHYKWKFNNPQFVAYIILAGTKDGRLEYYWREEE